MNKNLGTRLAPDYFENPYPFYQPHTEADMTLAKTELSFTPQFSPAAGIADYVASLEGRAK